MQKLTLVSAPAGFGKSTLVSCWLHTKRHKRFGWLSLDSGDNDPVRFFEYFQAALQTIDHKLGESLTLFLQGASLPAVEVLTTPLINELALYGQSPEQTDFVLVLDDYHLIENEYIHEAVTFLLEYVPSSFHLLLISRADPPLPLARWRARQQINELRADDLRFVVNEAAILLNDQNGLNLSIDDINTLTGRTEGWVAALQLAVLSIQGRRHSNNLVPSFGGSHRFIFDYLSDEVVSQLPVPHYDFLIRTSIVDRFCAPLCAYLFHNTDNETTLNESEAQAVIETFEQNNLFVIPLDDERCWYRYHHLFGEFLRKKLYEQLSLIERQRLYGCAAVWCDIHGLGNEAIQYALQSNDESLVLEFAHKYVLSALVRNDMHDSLQLFKTITDAGIELPALLHTMWAWALLFSGEIEKVVSKLAFLEAVPASAENAQSIVANCLALRSWLALFRNDLDETIELASQALEKLSDSGLDRATRDSSLLNLGNALLRQGHLTAAVEKFTAALEASQQSHTLIIEVLARTYLATSLLSEGKLRAAENGFQQVIAWAIENGQEYSATIGMARLGFAELLQEQNQLNQAAELVDHALELFEQTQNGTMLIRTLPLKARIKLAMGEYASAREALQYGDEVVLKMGRSEVPESHQALWAQINLHSGNEPAAYGWAKAQLLPSQNDLSPSVWDNHKYSNYLAVGLLWSTESPSKARQALSLLAQTKEIAHHNGFHLFALQATILQAAAWQTIGDEDEALGCLEEALAVAEPEGIVHSFVKVGLPIQRLLRLALRRDISTSFVRQLLTAFPDHYADKTAESDTQPLLDPLSKRELEVLALLAEGYSNAQIAEALVITVGTTKRHVSNILGKLAVDNRTQAVAHGRNIGLI